VTLAVAITGTGPIVIVQVDIRRENDIGGRRGIGIPVAGGSGSKPVMAVGAGNAVGGDGRMPAGPVGRDAAVGAPILKGRTAVTGGAGSQNHFGIGDLVTGTAGRLGTAASGPHIVTGQADIDIGDGLRRMRRGKQPGRAQLVGGVAVMTGGRRQIVSPVGVMTSVTDVSIGA